MSDDYKSKINAAVEEINWSALNVTDKDDTQKLVKFKENITEQMKLMDGLKPEDITIPRIASIISIAAEMPGTKNNPIISNAIEHLTNTFMPKIAEIVDKREEHTQPKPNIFYLDDYEPNLRMVKNALELQGHSVKTGQYLANVKQDPGKYMGDADVILLDDNLGTGPSGSYISKKYKKGEDGTIPVIMFSNTEFKKEYDGNVTLPTLGDIGAEASVEKSFPSSSFSNTSPYIKTLMELSAVIEKVTLDSKNVNLNEAQKLAQVEKFRKALEL